MAVSTQETEQKLKELEQKLEATEKELHRKNEALAEITLLLVQRQNFPKSITEMAITLKRRKAGNVNRPRLLQFLCYAKKPSFLTSRRLLLKSRKKHAFQKH